MRPDPARSPRGDEVPPALRGIAFRRAVLAPVTATMLAFVPVMVLSSPAYADPGDVSISPLSLEVAEDDTLTFDLTRIGGAGNSLTLNYAVTGTATSGEDYQAFGGQTTFANSANNIVKRFNIRGIGDAFDEADETITLTFTNPNDNNNVVATAEGVFVDDDETPNYTLTATTPISEAGGSATITATLNGGALSKRDIDIPLSTVAGSALAGQDYTARTNEVLHIPAMSPSGTITVPILDDTLDEADTQQFTVGPGSDPDTNVGTGSPVAVVIQDNDALPTINMVNPANAVEGAPVTFQATLSAASERAVTVKANTANGSATAGQDYTAVVDQTVTFAPGDTSEDIVVTTDGDLLDEVQPETLTLTLSDPSSTATLGTGSPATAGIDDDDNAPTITLTPGSVSEGDSGTSIQTFTVELDDPSGQEVVVGYQTSAGSATEGVDYDDVTAGTLTFAPNETTKTFDVVVRGDTIDEGAGETFNVVLSNPNNTLGASAALGTTVVTLTDDDAKPTLNPLVDVTRLEGGGNADFTLSLSNPSSQVITVDVAANDGTADVDGNGAGSNDYDAPPSTVTFLPGETSKTISVNVNADTVFEGNETADVVVTIPGGETDLAGTGVDATLTLTNDDTAPTVVLSSTSVAEDNDIAVTGTVTGVAQDDFPVTITLAGAAAGNGVPADAPDFAYGGPVNVNIPAGDNAGVQVPLHTFHAQEDDIDEATQQVRVTLTYPDTTSTSAYQSITDDPADLPPTVDLSNVSVAESDGSAVVDVDLTFDSNTNDATSTELPVVVPYTTADVSASAGNDYTAPVANSSVTVTPGDLDETISIPIVNDGAYELDETFTVNAGTLVNGTLGDGSATVTIQANDQGARPGFSVTNATKGENEGGPAVFTITLTGGPTTQDVTFDAAVVDGSAEDNGSGSGHKDFDQPTTPITITAGQPSATFEVPITNDAVYEAPETATVNVSLANGENDAVGGTDASLLTITDTDAAPSIALTPESSAEGTNIAVVGTVTGVAQEALDVSVSLAGAIVSGSDAAEASDFVNVGAVTVNIPGGDQAGAPLALREFRLNNDTIDENVETIVATVTDSDNVVADATGLYRINDDVNDLPPSLSIGNVTVSESTTPAVLDVDLTFSGETTATERPIVVDYTTVNGSAIAGTDYTSVAPGQLTITAGSNGGTISIPITPNTTDEPDRSFGVTLTSATPAGVQIDDAEGTVTITDDEADVPRPGFSVADATVEENEGPGVLTVTLDAPTVNDVTFAVGTADAGATDAGTGAGSNDYNAPLTTVTIPAGQPSATVSVPVTADSVFEGDEDVTVTVGLAQGETDAVGGTDTSTLTITNDDVAPSITLNTQSGSEGTDISVIATVTGQAQANTEFDLTVTGSSAGSNNAAEGIDYDDSGLQGVIPGGTTSGAKVVLRTIRLEQDTIDEPTESIGVLVQDSAGNVADASSVYRINDDPSDVPPSITLSDATVSEEDGTATVAVDLAFDGETDETERDIVLNYKTTNGSATSGSDYTAVTAGQLTIPAGTMSEQIAIPVTDDSSDENDQTFTVSITSVVPGETPVTDGQALVTIEDNDEPEAVAPTLTAPPVRVGSGNVTLSGVAAPGAEVELLAAPVGVANLVPVATTTAQNSGAYSFTRMMSTRGYQFRTRVGDLESPIRTVMVRHEPILTANSTRTGTLTLRAGNDPKIANLTILIQRLNANGTWSTVATGTTGTGGTYTRTFTGLRRGTSLTHRAYVVGNSGLGYIGAYSTAFRASVR
jgi:hypothetical protein